MSPVPGDHVREPTGTQSVDRAAALLVRVLESPEPMGFGALVAAEGLPKSTGSRLLAALERSGLVERDASGAVVPGAVLTRFARRGGGHLTLATLARPCLERLGAATGETINLAVAHRASVEQIAQVDSRYLLGGTDWVGLRVPLHCSGAGKVFLAYGVCTLPKGRLERRTPKTVVDRRALEQELARVVRRGYAVTDEELEPGLVAVAAPVHTIGGSVLAAVSVSGPSGRLTPDRVAAVGHLLVAETRALSAALGHPTDGSKEGAA